ncbi:MAG: hypothetical protein ACRDN0_30860 [Trebonia sp.]
MTVLAPIVGGLFLFSAAAIALFSHALTLVAAREEDLLGPGPAAPRPGQVSRRAS